ncbi:hypothetical protein Btru_056150 [Bulinus truncatus]|nr:hypothetical protein Btru_056150 [Bulinus truncatus]
MLLLVAYSVASESILYPETDLNAVNVYNIFRKGFWAMIGEYSLDEILGEDHCTEDPERYNNFTTKKCPTNDGKYVIPALLYVYALFVQILMFNLLIALFTNAISQSESERDQIWRYQRFQLTKQYAKTRVLLPPCLFLFFFSLRSKVGDPFYKESKDTVMMKIYEDSASCKIFENIDKDRDGGKFLAAHEKVRRQKVVSDGIRELMQVFDNDSRMRQASEIDREYRLTDMKKLCSLKRLKNVETSLQKILQLLEKERSVDKQPNDTKRDPDHHFEYLKDHHSEDRKDHHSEDRKDHHSEDRKDHHSEDRKDHHSEDRKDHLSEDRKDHYSEDRKDHHSEDRKDHHSEDRKDHLSEDRKDHLSEDRKDHHSEDRKDHLSEDRKGHHSEDRKDQGFKHTYNVIIEQIHDHHENIADTDGDKKSEISRSREDGESIKEGVAVLQNNIPHIHGPANDTDEDDDVGGEEESLL